MNDMSSMNRETKKNQLRRRVITTNAPQFRSSGEDSEGIVKEAERRVRRRHMIILLVILIVITAATMYEAPSLLYLSKLSPYDL